MNKPDSPQLDWSVRLLSLYQTMAKQHTNPVLLVLDGGGSIIRQQHYPAEDIEFGNGRWRAYYHCHDTPDQQRNEHGHFHLFTHLDTGWAHVAGLGMDHYGQPCDWFCVNRWVTGGPWLEQSTLDSQVPCEKGEADSLAGQWLQAMLQVCLPQLQQLFCHRDQRCAQLARGQPDESFFEDRNIYTLARIPLDIQAILESTLTPNRVANNDSHPVDSTKENSHV